MPQDAINLDEVKRALVIKLRHHGDVLLSSPVFTVLRRAAPHLEIDALVYADTRDMLAGHPAIRAVHGVGRDWRRLSPRARLAAEWALFATLRDARYDLVVHLTEHPRGAWLTRFLGPRWSVAPRVRGRGRLWSGAFSHTFPLPPRGRPRHTVELNLDALRRLGLRPAEEDRRLVLVPGEAAVQRVAGLLAEAGLTAGGFLHLHPASRWQFKCWPAGHNAELVDRLTAAGHRVVVTCAPDPREKALVEDILGRLARPVVDLSGQLTLKELAALTARARLFLGPDSMPMHMAAAMGTPVVAWFGPSGELEWGPWRVPHRILASNHSCRPCGNDGCGGGKRSECLEAVSVDQAWDAVMALLDAR